MRSTDTSSKSTLRKREELLNVIETDPRFARGEAFEPFQIRSSPRFPRMDFIDCSPKTNRTASATLDLPEPFGPTIAVTDEVKSKLVFLAKDLNPEISSRAKCMKVLYLRK